METIFTSCEHCAERFEAPAASAGGLTNCPSCGKATPVAGGPDVVWNAAIGLAILATVVFVALAALSGGLPMALLTFSGCALAALVVRLSA